MPSNDYFSDRIPSFVIAFILFVFGAIAGWKYWLEDSNLVIRFFIIIGSIYLVYIGFSLAFWPKWVYGKKVPPEKDYPISRKLIGIALFSISLSVMISILFAYFQVFPPKYSLEATPGVTETIRPSDKPVLTPSLIYTTTPGYTLTPTYKPKLGFDDGCIHIHSDAWHVGINNEEVDGSLEGCLKLGRYGFFAEDQNLRINPPNDGNTYWLVTKLDEISTIRMIVRVDKIRSGTDFSYLYFGLTGEEVIPSFDDKYLYFKSHISSVANLRFMENQRIPFYILADYSFGQELEIIITKPTNAKVNIEINDIKNNMPIFQYEDDLPIGSDIFWIGAKVYDGGRLDAEVTEFSIE